MNSDNMRFEWCGLCASDKRCWSCERQRTHEERRMTPEEIKEVCKQALEASK